MKFQENVSLAKFSHYKIGGKTRYFFEAKNEREVAWAVREAKAHKLPIFILGGGTNLLLSDDGFSGLVLKPTLAAIQSGKQVKNGDAIIEVGAGTPMADLLEFTVLKSLAGLEWAGGLPGTFGGAIRGNAGCFGGEIKDSLISVRSFNPRTMKVVERSARACAFAYRDSIFKKSAGREIILSAKLALVRGDKNAIAQAISEKIAHRMKNHPLEYPNIGSIFKNVALANICRADKKYQTALARQLFEFRGSQFSIKNDPFPVISAAKLISESGLRGVSFGGAMISAKHPNFIVNVLGAAAGDVKALMMLTKAEVKKRFGVQLEEEVQVV